VLLSHELSRHRSVGIGSSERYAPLPVYINKMDSTLKLTTERLILRPINLDDAKAVFQYRSDSNANKYQGWIPARIEDVDYFINNTVSNTINKKGTWFQFVITLKHNGELIGDIGLHFFDNENKQVEVGCTLNKDYQKKGFAKEAMDEIMKYIFITLNKHRIIASIDPENSSSIRLFEKLKFRKEAHFRKSIFIDGKWFDDLIYAILKCEWTNDKSINVV
jgi:RimJ/RimL family protein N-acetyltransferase